jgi:hypothetical protein
MKFLAILSCLFLIATPFVLAQIELVSNDYFPADLEFAELQKIRSEVTFEDPSRLAKVEDGGLIHDVGFVKYARRVYLVGKSHSLSIEILTLLDSRAAYSLSTLLRSGPLQNGPPGDFFTAIPDGIRFAQGKHWVRMQGQGVPEELIKRVAISITNRMGVRRSHPPSLVTHLPKLGLDLSSLRYFPSVKVYESYSPNFGVKPLPLAEDAEVALASYTLDSRFGNLTLLSFPTAEVADEYYGGLTGKAGNRLYAKRSGPIVGILEGSFEPGTADKLLRSIRYSYSVQWVYEKGGKPKTVWGVPAGVLTTVVKSLFFVALLLGFSILAGIGLGAFRVMLKRRISSQRSDQQDETEITRLKMS